MHVDKSPTKMHSVERQTQTGPGDLPKRSTETQACPVEVPVWREGRPVTDGSEEGAAASTHGVCRDVREGLAQGRKWA